MEGDVFGLSHMYISFLSLVLLYWGAGVWTKLMGDKV